MLRALVLLVAIIPCLAEGQDHFFPYGVEAGDSSLTPGNDEYQEVALQHGITFPFYGDDYINLYINANGLITFGKAWPTPQTGHFVNTLPLHPDLNADHIYENIICAAPFWADVDNSNGRGTIFYRSSQSSSDLGRAASTVRNNFPSFTEYTADRVIVATWELVSFYDHESTSTDPRNTFQAVLITDSVDSFVFFFYDKIEWTAGTTLFGNPETGIPDKDIHQAIVGFNKGDGYDAFEAGIPTERTDLPLVSNINQPGSYAFQVNQEEVAPAGCSNEVATFVTYPPFGSILGGEKINLYGPCWDGSNEHQMVCQFWNKAVDPPALLQTVNGSVEDQNTAYCIPEPFFLVGEVTIRVYFDGINLEKSGVYRIRKLKKSLNLDRISVPEKVTRVDGKSQIWYTAGQELRITWPHSVYSQNTMVDIDILNYDEDETIGPRWEKAFTIATGVENTGSRQFRTFGLNNVTADNAFGVIRVQPSGDKIGLKLYSDIHPLGYLLEDEFQSDPQKWAADQCRLWTEVEDLKIDFVENLESCPCTLDQALADTARFYSIHSCSMFHPEVENRCILNKGAKHCVMSIFPNKHHLFILSAAISFGDPHFITFDGSNYTFNGLGDYSLLHVGSPYNFKLEGRFEVIKAHGQHHNQKSVSGATGLTAAVMFEDNANAIYVETSDVSGIEIYRAQYDEETTILSEWELVNFRGQMWLDFPGKRILGAQNIVPDKSCSRLINEETCTGLLGNWNNKRSDDLTDARGQLLDLTKANQEEINRYADSWKTSKDGLFRKAFPKEYNESTYTAVTAPPDVRDLTSSEQNTLKQICDTNEQCRFDYLVTRNGDIAADTKATYHGFEWGQNKTKKIPVCKFIPTPANGTKRYQSKDPETGAEQDTPNNFIWTIITFECEDDLTLVGSSSRYCQENGEYSGSDFMNDCVDENGAAVTRIMGGNLFILLAITVVLQ
ncbi:hypothetical protein HOLleu_22576 [Holothuria leucospilota]|uniref:Uncharacterized protein n=1 Tax=Holothuria leucospilota TaxID=206669 RepID=A0A9Q1BXT9_HOLLE|nr:hypothetical protein HOLleu_22576 [Holothuria leucospilota]